MAKPDPLKSIAVHSGLKAGKNSRTSTSRSRHVAWWLSLAGSIPFVLLAGGIVWLNKDNPQQPILIDALKTYGAIVLSFLAGARWGIALRPENEDKMRSTLLKSVLPALIGWISLIFPLPYVFAVQALVFAAQGAWDSFAGQRGVFGLWYAKLRTIMTLIVTASMVAAFFATI